MLLLTKPASQDRLNAAVLEIIGLSVTGSVFIPGETWDAGSTARYAERNLKQQIALYRDSETGELLYFDVKNKRVCFHESGVEIQTLKK